MFFMYIVWSEKLRKYYIGSTADVLRRLQEHNRGKATFTKKGIPWKLVYEEEFETKKEARKREYEVKRYKGGIQFQELLNK